MNETPRIVAIGDSLIYGRHDWRGGGWIGRLRVRLERADAGSAVFNLGIGGEDSEGLLRRFEMEVIPREPNMVIIGVGVNDARRRGGETGPSQVPIDRFEDNIDKVLAAATRVSPRILLASVMPVDESRTRPLGEFYYTNKELRLYWAAQNSLGKKHGAVLLDFWPVVERAGGTVYSDGLHLAENGHELLCNVGEHAVASAFS